MPLTDVMNALREELQRSLDELISPRSTLRSKTLALQNLERSLATGSLLDSQDTKDAFFALQYTFECNVPSRLLPWIMATTSRLETLTTSNFKGQEDDGRETEIKDLSSQLATSLMLIQGVTLNHEASKTYMGRKPSLEILLDLLLTSRHLTTGIGTGSAVATDFESSPTKGAGHTSPVPPQPPLTSLVLDTLLCILVDSSPALRAFEQANGVQSIVKILKRAGTPREVRMKCLEFLYFYLLDETPDPSSSSLLTNLKAMQPTPPPTAPATPVHPSSSSSPSSSSFDVFPTPNPKQKPYMNATPLRPSTMSRYGSSSFSFSTSTSTSTSTGASPVTTDASRLSTSASSLASISTSSRSTSGSSMYSFSSTSSNASSETAASSMPASPVKESFATSGSLLDQAKLDNSKSSFGVRSPVKRAGIPSASANGNGNMPASKMMTTAMASDSTSTSTSGNRRQATPILPRSLMMLRKEVDFIPLSPKKSPSAATSSTSSSASSAPPATPPPPTEKRGQHLQRADTTPIFSSGSGLGLGSGVKLVPRSQPRAEPRVGTRIGHRKSLSTSTIGASGCGSGFDSPAGVGVGVDAGAGERARMGVGVGVGVGAGRRARTGMESSLSGVLSGKGSMNTNTNTNTNTVGGFGGSGEDTDVDVDVDVDGDKDKETEEKDGIGIGIDRSVLSSSSSYSSSTAFSSSLVVGDSEDKRQDQNQNQDPNQDEDHERERERKWKTTEEKKKLLGTMLGNVDALVEGVRKAGIWGLG